MLVQLGPEHRDLIHQMRTDAERWLAAKGTTDQYQHGIDPDAVRRTIDDQIDDGSFRGLSVNGEIVAVVALTDPDPELWTAEELAQPQTYIGRLLVADDQHGRRYGQKLLEEVAAAARRRHHHDWIRMNVWSTNDRLHKYYEDLGFRHVRTVNVPERMSGALFERWIRPLGPTC